MHGETTQFINTYSIKVKVSKGRMSGLFETTFLTSRHAVTSARSRCLNTEFRRLGDKLWRSRWQMWKVDVKLTLNLPTTTIVAQPFNVIKWQLKFSPVA